MPAEAPMRPEAPPPLPLAQAPPAPPQEIRPAAVPPPSPPPPPAIAAAALSQPLASASALPPTKAEAEDGTVLFTLEDILDYIPNLVRQLGSPRAN